MKYEYQFNGQLIELDFDGLEKTWAKGGAQISIYDGATRNSARYYTVNNIKNNKFQWTSKDDDYISIEIKKLIDKIIKNRALL